MDILNELRPKSLEEMILSKDLYKELSEILESEFKYKSFLCHGPSGTGKTTFAQIYATSRLGDLNLTPDYFEFNCSNNRKLEDARYFGELLSTKSMLSDFKVLVLDEAHGLITQAQNELLIPLEKAPDGNYCFLLSSEPEKLIDGILTRCKHIDFRPKVDDLFIERSVALIERVAEYNARPILRDAARNLLKSLLDYYGQNIAFRTLIFEIDKIIRKNDLKSEDHSSVFSELQGSVSVGRISNYINKKMLLTIEMYDKKSANTVIDPNEWSSIGPKLLNCDAETSTIVRQLFVYYQKVLASSDHFIKTDIATKLLEILSKAMEAEWIKLPNSQIFLMSIIYNFFIKYCSDIEGLKGV